MSRPALTFLVTLSTLSILASGCATHGGRYASCQTNREGNCESADAISAAYAMGALLIIGGAYYVVTQVSHSDPPPPGAPAPVERPLAGRVRWQGAFEGVPSVRVTLRRKDGPVLQATTTDPEGRFQLSLPRKTDWYIVAVDAPGAEGETSVWLQDRPPDAFEVLARPR
jgi:hypothetical protein